jgi:hypothetical protein
VNELEVPSVQATIRFVAVPAHAASAITSSSPRTWLLLGTSDCLGSFNGTDGNRRMLIEATFMMLGGLFLGWLARKIEDGDAPAN